MTKSLFKIQNTNEILEGHELLNQFIGLAKEDVPKVLQNVSVMFSTLIKILEESTHEQKKFLLLFWQVRLTIF